MFAENVDLLIVLGDGGGTYLWMGDEREHETNVVNHFAVVGQTPPLYFPQKRITKLPSSYTGTLNLTLTLNYIYIGAQEVYSGSRPSRP